MVALPLLLITLVAFLLILDTKKGILAAIILRPIIDCFWSLKYMILGVKPTELIGVVFPLLVFMKILISREQKFFRYPFCTFWAIFIFFQLFSTVVMVSHEGVLGGLNYFFRAFNGYVGFLVFQEFFHEREDFKQLLMATIIAGLAPLSMSVYQNLLGGAIRTEATIAGMVRNVGFYHDAYTLRYYALQTLTALILYGAYFMRRGQLLVRSFITTMGLLCIMTVFKILSKAGYLILAEWTFIWYLLKRRILPVLAFAIAAVVVLAVTHLKSVDTLKSVYSGETAALEGGNRDASFGGRMAGWEYNFNQWIAAPVYLKIIGSGDTALGAHNDFLRALVGTGIVGLALYLLLLGWALLKVARNCLRDASPLNIMALMLLFMWLTDAIGLVPGVYPGYQIYVWGFVGLSFRGVESLDTR
jgi:hypothetical protein